MHHFAVLFIVILNFRYKINKSLVIK